MMKLTEVLDNTTNSIDSLYNTAKSIQDKCEDFHVSYIGNNVRMNPKGGLQFFDGDNLNNMPMAPHAIGQLGEKIGVPGNYLLKCIEEGFSELAADNANTWLAKMEKSKMFIRTCDDHIRGILSDRFSMCDAPDIIEILGNNISEHRWNIKGSYINDERMHLRFVGADKMEIAKDDIFPAIFVDSSDVGRCALHVQFGIYRLACTNGMVVAESNVMYHQKHVGIDIAEFVTALERSLRKIPDFIANAEDIVKYSRINKIGTFNDEEIGDLLRKIKEKKELNQNERYMHSVINEIHAKTKLSAKNIREVLKIQNEKYDDSRWGLANAITEYAHDVSLDTRVELERSAARLLAA